MTDASASTLTPELAGRLERHASFVELVASQLDAARNDDADRFRELREELDRFLAESADPDDPNPEEDYLSLLTNDISLAVAALGDIETAERQAKERWNQLNDGAVRTARTVPAPRISTRRYPDYEPSTARVDVRL